MKPFLLLTLCLLFGCSASTNQGEKSPVPVTNLEIPTTMDELDGVFRLPREGAARNAIINWLLAVLVATQLWQLKQFYSLNREVGEANARLGRISSDSDSEKATRARVNALILHHLNVDDASIEEVLRETKKEA